MIPDPQQLKAIASQFTEPQNISEINRFGNGNINDTFLVSLDAPSNEQFILQRLNRDVFTQPDLVMQNMRTLTDHVHKRLLNSELDRRWEISRVLHTKTGQNYLETEDKSFWRAISFIDGSHSVDVLENQHQATEIGHTLGTFHALIDDLPPENLADTLEGFHITPRYLQQYDTVLNQTVIKQTPEINHCLAFVEQRRDWASVLEEAKDNGKLPLRLMHGDPKVNNVLFDSSTGKAVSIIDLDTVKPGLVHYDIGDCLRSGCNPVGEETEDWKSVYFETELCQGILQGYLDAAKAFFSDNDYAYVFDSMRLIAFELGLRFFCDYLEGNVYFRNVSHPEHNLARALVQFQLTKSIEAQEETIRRLVGDLRT